MGLGWLMVGLSRPSWAWVALPVHMCVLTLCECEGLRPKVLDPRPKALDPRLKALDPRPKALDPRPKTLHTSPKVLDPRPKAFILGLRP